LVNEILPSGDVLHLRNTDVPLNISSQLNKTAEKEEKKPTEDKKQDEPAAEEAAPEAFQLADDDLELLKSLFGDDASQQIIDFHVRVRGAPKAAPGKFGQVNAGVVDGKDTRTKMHMTLRRVFNSLLSSATDKDNNMIISAMPNRHKKAPKGFRGETGNRNERSKWEDLGGPYLHFTIYKENKDTMEVIGFLARMLRMNSKSFQFAGTKDRRGVTVQRACVFKVFAERLSSLNKTLRNAVLGDFEYSKHGLDLGELNGNEFVITLRECQFPDPQDSQSSLDRAKGLVETAMHNLRDRGYLNYYGLQRFGTFSKGTHETGIKLLQSDFKGAVDTILDYSPRVLAAAQGSEAEGAGSFISSDDKARAEAIYIFNTTRNVNNALDKLPRKFTAETSIIRHLGRSGNDYLGALQTVPRNLRLMYVHAYQSLVWNHAAGERWRLYGDKVVEGDLVIINNQEEQTTDEQTVDADGEVVVAPQVEDSATTANDAFTRARPLSADEAASGEYTIFDIVLPTPGFDICYPANQMTEFYKQFMASEQGGGLDPFDMRRKRRDIGLSGSYRTLLSRPSPDYSYQVKAYSQDDQQLVETDLESLKREKAGSNDEEVQQPESAVEGDKIAAVLKFQLGAGQYATMALRELMKLGGVREYKPEFMGR
jgi:tRNA pseudouridine13 synthase